MEQIFVDLGTVIILSTFLAIIFYKFKQSPIFGYIIAGVIAGPILKIIQNEGLINLLSQIGVTFLLFIVGLELNINQVKKHGKTALTISILQMILVFIVSYLISRFYFDEKFSLFIGLLVSFSSTTIVAKFLSENNAMESMHGRIAVLCLVIQDITSIVVLSVMQTFGSINMAQLYLPLLKAGLFIAVTYILAKFVIIKILDSISKSRELLLLSTVSMVFLFGGFASYLGLNSALGDYLAGFFLSSSILSLEISNEIKSLRDFFIVLFFFSVGAMFTTPNMELLKIVALMLFLGIIVKQIIIFLEMKIFRYGNRTSFMTSVLMSQLSIFSIIIARAGYNYGIIPKEFVVAASLAVVLSMLISTYFMEYSEKIYELISKYLKPLDKFNNERLDNAPKRIKNHIVIFGAHQIGMKIISSLKKTSKKFIIVDIDSEKIKRLIKEKYYAVYGNMNSQEILDKVNIKKAKFIISTVSQFDYNSLLIRRLKRVNKSATTIFFARSKNDALKLYALGVNYVMIPEIFGGKKVYDYLIHLSPRGIKKWGKRRYKELIEESNI